MTAVVGFSLLRCLPSELNEMIEGMIAVEGRAGGRMGYMRGARGCFAV